MKRPAVVTLAVLSTVAVLVVGVAGPTAGAEWTITAGPLRTCPTTVPAAGESARPTAPPAAEAPAPPAPPAALPGRGSHRRPVHPDAGSRRIAAPVLCRAVPTQVQPVRGGQLPVPRPGYHHLGATTLDGWSGILGRLTVRDPAVRAGSYDFVATRFMAKQRLADGRLGWLEVGWTETGWSGGGAQRIYTFDSNAMAWAFYDGYRLADGDQVWVYLQSDAAGRWLAWLWWAASWHLLAAPANLPLGQRAQLEQYVEVHVDRERPRSPISVPPIRVDRVRLQPDPSAPLAGWHADTVPTAPQLTSEQYCLSWENRFDTWSAGDCAVTVQE